MTSGMRPPPYLRRRTAVESWMGSLPVLLAQEPGHQAVVATGLGVVGLALAGVPLPWPLWVFAACHLCAWLLLTGGHAVLFGRWRRQSRAAGLSAVVLVPENARLLRRVLRMSGCTVARRPNVLAVHVDEGWRPSGGRTPEAAASEFGRQYRADYDRILEALAGLPVLVVSATFNRHESDWTRRAVVQGWCRSAGGPLFRGALARNRRRRRAATQRRMFGGVVSARRVDRPEAWRVRVFDCLAAPQAPVAGRAAEPQHVGLASHRPPAGECPNAVGHGACGLTYGSGVSGMAGESRSGRGGPPR